MNIIEIREQTEELIPKFELWEVMNQDGVMVATKENATDYNNIEIICKQYGRKNMSLFFCYNTGERKEGHFYTGVIR